MIVTHIDGRSELLTDYTSLQRKRRVNGEYSLSFLLFKTERNEHSFDLAIEESLIEYDGQEYRIKKMTDKTIGNTVVKQIEAFHIFFDLVEDYQYDTIMNTQTLSSCLEFSLQGTGYTYEVIDSFNSSVFESFGNDNALTLVQKALNVFGAEVEINGKHLKFYQQIGRDTDIQFRYKHNVKNLERYVDTSNLSTVIKGFGKKNEDGSYVVTAEYKSPLYDYYGERHAKPVYDERYTIQSELLERIKSELIDTPQVGFKIDGIELLKLGVDTSQTELGDRTFVIYEPLNVDINARVMEIVDFPESNSSAQYTFENFRNNLTDTIADFQKTKDQMDAIMNGQAKLPMSAMDDAIKRATIDLLEAETELSFENGILAVDPNDPNKRLFITSTGIGISTDGGKTFKEAITANGFVLSAGVIGSLKANNIDVNELSAISANLGRVTAGHLTGVTITTNENVNMPRVLLNEDRMTVQNKNNYIKFNTTYGNAIPYPSIEIANDINASDNDKAFIYRAPESKLLAIINNGSRVTLAGTTGVHSISEIYGTSMELGGSLEVRGNFNVQGTKNASVPTSIGYVNISAYETAEYYFGDVGRGEVKNGECIIEIESLFNETVNTDINYEVFLTPYGQGQIYVDIDEMKPDSFVVKGDNIKFAYEIKAKRKGYETTRLEIAQESEVSTFENKDASQM